jgi:hypothetical protein
VGPLNDQSRSGHPLHSGGRPSLRWAGQVEASEWIADLERRDRVHPSYDPTRTRDCLISSSRCRTRLLSRSWSLADLRVLTCGVVAAGREICALARYGAVAGQWAWWLNTATAGWPSWAWLAALRAAGQNTARSRRGVAPMLGQVGEGAPWLGASWMGGSVRVVAAGSAALAGAGELSAGTSPAGSRAAPRPGNSDRFAAAALR